MDRDGVAGKKVADDTDEHGYVPRQSAPSATKFIMITSTDTHLMATPTRMKGLLLGATVLFSALALLCTSLVATRARAEAGAAERALPVVAAATHGLPQLNISLPNNSRHLPDPRLPALTQQLPAYAAPATELTQQIVIHNDEAHPRQITVTQQLPVGLAPVVDADWQLPANVQWNPAQHQWTWTGQIVGGNRDYLIEPTTADIPYLDLATFGVANICDQFAEIDENDIQTVTCDDVAVTLNIGRQGQSSLLYGTAWRSLTLHADGFVTFGDAAAAEHPAPQILPTSLHPLTLSPLHADLDLSYTSSPTSTTQIGRWHAAVIAEWLDGRDTLYVQWHDVPLSADVDATARFALAIPLWSDNETPPEIETAFYIYDNISHPSRLIDAGYSIGIQDGAGERGMSYAYSVAGDVRGHPPTPSVLRVLPVRYGDAEAATQTISLRWQVSADIPTHLISTVALTSDSTQPPLDHSWDTQSLAVRYLTYLPAIIHRESTR